eukprot:961301-Pleurochrysis_carterae.AAC.2
MASGMTNRTAHREPLTCVRSERRCAAARSDGCEALRDVDMYRSRRFDECMREGVLPLLQPVMLDACVLSQLLLGLSGVRAVSTAVVHIVEVAVMAAVSSRSLVNFQSYVILQNYYLNLHVTSLNNA